MNADRGGAQWDAIAEDYDQHAAISSYNALYDRPAVLDLLGLVAAGGSSTSAVARGSTPKSS